ncbi:TPA: hypothetical protein HA251_06135 [Candidatus Woesearchaeota archaeon]|nr:hypothetical protein [Candidatus Woesearchaeota archaeon]
MRDNQHRNADHPAINTNPPHSSANTQPTPQNNTIHQQGITMYASKLLTIMTVFAIGIAAGLFLAGGVGANDWQDGTGGDSTLIPGDLSAFNPFIGVTPKESPRDRIPERAIAVYNDRVVLDMQEVEWATFTDTHSMEPVIFKGANALEIRPKSEDDIKVGDIASYKSEYSEGTIIHRVVYKGVDESGTYFIFKGDNLPTSDPGRVRFSQIQRVVVGLIY